MTEIERIRDQLHRAFYGPAWHGPALGETLEGVTAALAARKPPGGAHSIWEIARHAAFWEAAVLRRARGDRTGLDPSADWGKVPDQSAAAWKAERTRLLEGHDALEKALLDLPDDRLEQVFPGKNTLYTLLHGAVQHDLYHAGQIQLLKRILKKG
jgi:uncharacterized damage-inducible protein DinB